MKNKYINLSLILLFAFTITACSNKENEDDKENTKTIDYETISENEIDAYESGKTIDVSGTNVLLGEKYMIEAYGTDVQVIDLDFEDYNFGVTLPTALFDYDNLYFIQPETDGTVNITTNYSNKTLLNFMDDIRFSLLNYNYGYFSTWESAYNETTFYNLKRSTINDLISLVTEENYIVYEDGYRFAKYYDMYEDDAYRIEMEVDVYPFRGNTTFKYHGYLTMLCHDGIMRSILFAEPKYNEDNPYQLIYPVSRSTFLLNVGTNWDVQPENTVDDMEIETVVINENKVVDTQEEFSLKEKNVEDEIQKSDTKIKEESGIKAGINDSKSISDNSMETNAEETPTKSLSGNIVDATTITPTTTPIISQQEVTIEITK